MIDELDLSPGAPRLKYVCGECARENDVDVDTLVLGHDTAEIASPNMIHLPTCGCGAVTFLNRTWDSVPAADTPARRAINSLAEYLRTSGRSGAKSRDIHAAESTRPPMMLDRTDRPVLDLLGRKQRAAEEAAARAAAERQAEQDRRQAERAEAARIEVTIALMKANREAAAKASVNKRLGLPPGSEPPADALAAELAKSVVEFRP